MIWQKEGSFMFKVKSTSNVEVKNVGLYLLESKTPMNQTAIFQKWDNLIFGPVTVSQIDFFVGKETDEKVIKWSQQYCDRKGIILNVINA